MSPAAVRDDFAGPGGWDEGLRLLGITDVIGIEHDASACATAEAAGHRRIRADVSNVDSADWKGIDGYIASPPCPTFSLAGLGAGRNGIDVLAGAARALADGDDAARDRVVVELYLLIRRPLWRKQAATYRAALRGERRAKAKRPAKTKISQSALVMARMSALVLEPVRAVRDLRPRWVALEQVPPVLPLWEAMAAIFRGWGYNVSTGVVNAADVGVPQTRQRAFLVARSDGPAALPSPTHAKDPEGTLFGQLDKWVSMAEALGWNGSVERQRGQGLLARGGERREHPTDEPSPTVTVQAGGGCGPNLIYHPALSDPPDMADDAGMQSGNAVDVSHLGHGEDNEDPEHWSHSRPSTTIVGSFKPDVVAPPGWRTDPLAPRQDTPGAVRISPQQAAVLQSFPPDYPWQGNKGKVFEQIGNAVPPRLAAAVVGALLGLAWPAALADPPTPSC